MLHGMKIYCSLVLLGMVATAVIRDIGFNERSVVNVRGHICWC